MHQLKQTYGVYHSSVTTVWSVWKRGQVSPHSYGYYYAFKIQFENFDSGLRKRCWTGKLKWLYKIFMMINPENIWMKNETITFQNNLIKGSSTLILSFCTIVWMYQ